MCWRGLADIKGLYGLTRLIAVQLSIYVGFLDRVAGNSRCSIVLALTPYPPIPCLSCSVVLLVAMAARLIYRLNNKSSFHRPEHFQAHWA